MSADQDALGSDALRAFAVFAEHRNFTTAAAQLRLSQPSLHVKIRKLGAALGVDLYQREGRQLALTTAGEQLAAFAQDAQRRVAEFLTELHDNPAPLRLAAGRGALRWVISSAVQALIRSARPLQLVPANREAALGALSAGTADLAVIAFDPPPRGLRSRQIAEYPQVLAIGTRLRWPAGPNCAGPTWPGLICWYRRPVGRTAARSNVRSARSACRGASRPKSTAGT